MKPAFHSTEQLVRTEGMLILLPGNSEQLFNTDCVLIPLPGNTEEQPFPPQMPPAPIRRGVPLHKAVLSTLL